MRRFIDIGANLTDPMYKGLYRGKTAHPDDLARVIARGIDHGVERMMVTGGSADESSHALALARSHPALYSTCGCHPTRCSEMEDYASDQGESGDVVRGPSGYMGRLRSILKDGESQVVAIGEIGLDYARLQFCPKEIQIRNFDLQLQLYKEFQKPLFLHLRDAADDFIEVLKRHGTSFRGVVHSFDGSWEVAQDLLAMDLHLGCNGCSLKTDANLDVWRRVPLDRILLETDCPWCEIRPSHAGFKHVQTKFEYVKKEKWVAEKSVKSRLEPAMIIQVAEVLSAVRGERLDDVIEAGYANTMNLFFPDEHKGTDPYVTVMDVEGGN